ncbi:MAG: ABC transporter ATP-binding protein [Candidatus Berkelbacteria bacterium]
MIKITDLVKKYGNTVVVDNLNLSIKKGSIFGFLGPNGAGKTTTIKMIIGLSQKNAGNVEIDGKDLSNISSRENIGYMPEDPYFYDQLTATEFLAFMAGLFKGKTRNIDETLELVGLKHASDQKVGTFSKGMKQRLGLAQTIINDPDYIFMDEPLDGLDPIGRLEFKKIFLKLKNEGKTIFFNSHILSDVEEICDEIGIICYGKLIYAGNIEKFCKGDSLEKKFVETIHKFTEEGNKFHE